LPKGTTEGCREPLLYARKRLPAMRRILPPADHRAPTDEDTPPIASRGEGLDRHLNDLLGSVTTALDQYQVESGSDTSDVVQQELAVEVSKITGTWQAIRKSQALDPAIEDAKATSLQLDKEGIERADQLARQFQDAETHNQLARAELSGKTARVSWYQPLVAGLRNMPVIIENTGKWVQRSVDRIESLDSSTKPVRDFVRKTRGKVFRLAVELMRDVDEALEQVGHEMKAQRDKRDAASVTQPELDSPFDIERARELIVLGRKLPQSWSQRISGVLEFSDASNMRDLLSLKDLNALRRLSFANTQASDLSPLAHLTTLEIIHLDTRRSATSRRSQAFQHCSGSLSIARGSATSRR
jgi:hypothetical protein